MFHLLRGLHNTSKLLVILIGWQIVVAPRGGLADVVVVSNRTGVRIEFELESELGKESARLSAGASRPFVIAGTCTLSTAGHTDPSSSTSKLDEHQYELVSGNAYYFSYESGETPNASPEIQFQRIALGGDATTWKGPSAAPVSGQVVIPVSLWVDDEQVFTKKYWRAALTKRLDQAAAIVELHSGVRFHVERVGSWDSDDGQLDFAKSLKEFIDEVEAGDTVAIGFSSQYKGEDQGGEKLGGTRFPLDRHILVQEWRRGLSEAERVEVLVHELGHHLGAAHTLDRTTVMRPVLGDGLARYRQFRIEFDPVNTLAMSLVGDELRRGKVTSIRELSQLTRNRLQEIYTEMLHAAPNDRLMEKYVQIFQ